MELEKKRHLMKIFRVIICIVLLCANFMSSAYIGIFNPNTVMAATAENSGIIRTADSSTVDSYKLIETNGEIGGRYNGRVWTDKSVYSHDTNPTVKLDERFNISYDDDFETLLWDNGDYVMEITGHMTKNELINSAKSLKISEIENTSSQNQA